jgi:hypothetical protein
VTISLMPAQYPVLPAERMGIACLIARES